MRHVEIKVDAQLHEVKASEQASDGTNRSEFGKLEDEYAVKTDKQTRQRKQYEHAMKHESKLPQQSIRPPSKWTQGVNPSGLVPRARILVPLYIYPASEHTWQPLYQAISNNPNCEFVIIVNPNSGPGDNALPSHDYLREIPKLNSYSNVQTVGYMKIDWCRRPLSETFADIGTFASWSSSGCTGLYVEGVYVDETPNHFTEDRAQYLLAVRKYIRALPGLFDRRLIFENPGTPPDKELTWYANCGPDVVVTCEEPYERFISDEVLSRLSEYHYDQPQSAYQISGVPRELIGTVVKDLHYRGAYLFVTDLVNDFYESFGEGWSDFIEAF